MNTPGTRTDEELAAQARGGCLDSFEELVRRHEGRLYQFLWRLTGNHATAQDLTQETFLRAWRYRRRYRCRYRFVTWLFAIARRQAISYWRRQPAPTVALTDQLPAPAAGGDGADEIWWMARRVLPEKQYTALWLKYAEEMPVREVAGAMGLTVVHVKVLLHRGRQHLARALASSFRKEQPNELCPGPMEDFTGRRR